ncbi:MAG TPA: hypothetical protein VKB95_06810 [Chitinophagaceae bacterium]|nr:hypothetical protein [Chitinophagaceae bacterium]
MNRILIKIKVFILYGSLFNPIQAQQSESVFDWEELIFSENHFSLQFIYGRSAKAVINPDPRIYNIGTKSYECLEGGIGYHYSINKKYSIQTGIRGGGIMRDIRYYIPGADFNPPLSYDVRSYKIFDKFGVVFFRIPFFIERRFFTKPGVYWNAQAGISLLYSFMNEEIYESRIGDYYNRSIRYLYSIFTPNNNQKPWLNYHVGGGLNLILKNKDVFRINLVGELSFTKFFRGYYSFEVPGNPSIKFDYGVTGSYVALEASYIRTKAKRKFKQLKLQ